MRKLAVLTVFAVSMSGAYALNAQQQLMGTCNAQAKASRAAGLKLRFGTAFLDQPGNLANAGDVALGHYVSHPFNIEAAGEQGEKFATEYQAKTGHLPAYIEPQTVFALQMVGNVLKTLPAEDGRLNTRSFALALEKASDSKNLHRFMAVPNPGAC